MEKAKKQKLITDVIKGIILAYIIHSAIKNFNLF